MSPLVRPGFRGGAGSDRGGKGSFMGETILVVGGMRSGKSRLAERLAGEHAPVTLVATATVDPTDAEMSARIARHRADRPADWTTIEAPRGLETILPDLSARVGSVLIDCATLWITNLLLGLGGGGGEPGPLEDDAILAAVDASARAARGQARVIWVSNEVGSGIIPIDPLARRFADLQGRANQRLAEACDSAYLCVSGLSVRLK
jgi:adenosylcobinamide kinase/adenosylcobinamide-phosphate guanylyltransferase